MGVLSFSMRGTASQPWREAEYSFFSINVVYWQVCIVLDVFLFPVSDLDNVLQ